MASEGLLMRGAFPEAMLLVSALLPPRALSLPAKLFCSAASMGNADVARSAGELQARA